MVTNTKEESKLYIYATAKRPTSAETVTHKTQLSKLNLNWTEKDLPERIRTKHVHRLHPYLGKFIPQLAEIFLRKYFSPGDTVLDPFCGSGTTLVQANELGINSIGYDISAFNVLLCRAKTAAYDIPLLKKEVYGILEQVREITLTSKHKLDLFDSKARSFDPQEVKNDYLRNWYSPQALFEITAYRDLINAKRYKFSNLLRIILSRSARSARLTRHFDLDFPKKPQKDPYYCHKHSRTCFPTREAFKFLKRYSIDTIKRIEEHSLLQTNASTTIKHGDSKRLKIPEIDGVITSPPYVGLIDYHEQHIYAYNLFDLKDRSVKEIGAAANGTSKKAKEAYQRDIVNIFKRVSRAIKRGGHFIVVANDKYDLYQNIANEIGCKTEGIIQRHVNRRTGRRNSHFFESVFIWKKI